MATRKEKENVEKVVKVESTANIKSEETEKYVSKVIIDGKWGDGPGEFGMDVHSTIYGGPGNLVIDDDNLYIYDCANNRIYKYSTSGTLKKTFQLKKRDETGNPGEEEIVNFTVKDDTLYGVIFPGLNGIEEIIMIDTKTGEKIGIAEVCFWNSYHTILDIENNNGEILLTRGREKRYRLEVNYEQGYMFLSTTEIGSKDFGEFKRLDKAQGSLAVGRQKFLISNVKGEKLSYAEKLSEDIAGNIYIVVWSSSPVGSLDDIYFKQIFKFSKVGTKLAVIDIPTLDGLSEGDKPIQVSEKGDIYYLYCTGKWTEQKNWKPPEFIPGKVQLIKWELQK